MGDEGWAELRRCWIVDEILLPLLSSLVAGPDHTDSLTRLPIVHPLPPSFAVWVNCFGMFLQSSLPPAEHLISFGSVNGGS